MTLYKADVWLGSNSGFQTITVSSSSINGVTEQIIAVYNVKRENIRNIRKVSGQGEDTSISIAGLGLLVLFVLFAFYPTITLTLLFGCSGSWITTKLSGKSFSLICEKQNKKLYNVLIIVTLLFGGVGFYIGNNIETQNTIQSK